MTRDALEEFQFSLSNRCLCLLQVTRGFPSSGQFRTWIASPKSHSEVKINSAQKRKEGKGSEKKPVSQKKSWAASQFITSWVLFLRRRRRECSLWLWPPMRWSYCAIKSHSLPISFHCQTIIPASVLVNRISRRASVSTSA